MNRQKKDQVVATLKQDLVESPASFLVGYKGLDVAQMNDLRHALRAQGGACRVAKVTLIRRGIDEVPAVQGLGPFVKKQIALVFARQEPVSVAKVLHAFAKENEKFELIAGCLDTQLLDKWAISALATLPSREVLLGQVCGLVQGPATGLACTMTMVIKQLMVVVKKVAEKQAK